MIVDEPQDPNVTVVTQGGAATETNQDKQQEPLQL